MKKTLLTALMLIASAVTMQAQGFKVYRSDGAVYQFSWVADSLVFFEGEGDPNYQEPVPEEVREALEILKIYAELHSDEIKGLKTDVAKLYALTAYNEDKITNLENALDVYAKLTDVAELDAYISILKRDVDHNSTKIKNLENIIDNLKQCDCDQSAVETLQGYVETLEDKVNEIRVSVAEMSVSISTLRELLVNHEDKIDELRDANADKDARIKVLEALVFELSRRLAALESKVQ